MYTTFMFLNLLRRKVFKELEFLWWQYIYIYVMARVLNDFCSKVQGWGWSPSPHTRAAQRNVVYTWRSREFLNGFWSI